MPNPSPTRVELRAARIPGLTGLIADHYWLLVTRGLEASSDESCDRWEIWQFARRNDCCWGHLHKNLLAPRQGVGNGPSRLIEQWTGDAALRLAAKIEASPQNYPYTETYRYWPGPNSNTYAQWVVADKLDLGRRAIGKSYPVAEIG